MLAKLYVEASKVEASIIGVCSDVRSKREIRRGRRDASGREREPINDRDITRACTTTHTHTHTHTYIIVGVGASGSEGRVLAQAQRGIDEQRRAGQRRLVLHHPQRLHRELRVLL